jgi:iron complex transport system permease protein
VIPLAGGSVAAAGPIAFVGLAVPNAVRAMVGNDYRWILPLSGVLGAVFVLAADIVARTIERPAEIETGLVIEAIGAPVFLFLVSRRRLPGL